MIIGSTPHCVADFSTSEIADDWAERWREFHRPLVLDGELAVRPPWAPAQHTPIDLVIDPGQAFGTGAHATTRLCLELMVSLPERSGPLLDLGCGSGVGPFPGECLSKARLWLRHRIHGHPWRSGWRWKACRAQHATRARTNCLPPSG